MRSGSKRRIWQRVVLVLICGLFPGVAAANPVSYDPMGSLSQIMRTGVVCVALAAEVALVSFLIIMLCGAGRRVPLGISLLLLNVFSYFVFIRLILPKVENVFLVETVIWLVEALAILAIARAFFERPVMMKGALAISLAGNLTSYLVGLAI